MRIYNDNGELIPRINETNADAPTTSKEDAPTATSTVNVQLTSGAVTILTYTNQGNVETTLSQEGTSLLNNTTPNFLGAVDVHLDDAEVGVSNITAKQSKDATLVDIVDEKNADNGTDTATKQTSSKQILLQSPLLDSPSNKPNESRSLLIRSQKDKPSDTSAKQLLNESQLDSRTNDSSTTDPLEFADEFVNTNLLDNPDFLKSLTANSSNTLFGKGEVSIDKTEDSDIEILENVESTEVVAEKTKSTENDTNQTTELEPSKEKTAREERSESCDTTEDKYTSNEASENSNNSNTRFLTLEDIKHTGHTGLDLYKCGFDECNFATTASLLLKKHLKECSFRSNDKNVYCAHCKKRFIKIGFLLEHLKVHGLRRFGCSLCKLRYPVQYQATAHMRAKHKFSNTKLVPADPTNPSVDGLFIVQAIVSFSQKKK